MSRISYLLSQNFCYSHLNLVWWITLLYGSPAYVWASGVLVLFMFGPLSSGHASLKWFSLLHLLHVLPNAGHCLCMCAAPQYLQFSTLCCFFCSFVYYLSPILLCLLLCIWSKSFMLFMSTNIFFLCSLHFHSLVSFSYLLTVYFLHILSGHQLLYNLMSFHHLSC